MDEAVDWRECIDEYTGFWNYGRCRIEGDGNESDAGRVLGALPIAGAALVLFWWVKDEL